MAEKQKTIGRPVNVQGTGLHTGKFVTLTFKPAPENHGIRFKRIDLDGQPEIEANVDYVCDTSRGTTLSKNGASVATTEHVLAAASGFGIDNLIIELDAEETPIMDGSSRFFVEALKNAGIVEQNAPRNFIILDREITFNDPSRKTEMIAIPCDEFRVSTMINYETQVLDTQNAVMDSIRDFETEIANSRTFVFLHELEFLLNNNLIRGGDLSNAIVFVNRMVSQEELDRLAELFNKPKVKVLKEGILNNLELHHLNEPARHKLLDVVGDLVLLGKPIKAHIIARRPGHQTNVQFAKIIKEHAMNKTSKSPQSRFDLNKEPLFDINQIKKILPHRPPFLFIDKILEMSDTHVVGVKNVTMNEPFFVGHFPDDPVMPGVIQIEAMAQTGGVLLLNTVPDPHNYITLFLKIDNVKFRKKVVPGDTIVFHLELVEPIRRGICHMKGTAYVGDNIVMEGKMMASIIKKDIEETENNLR
ncbi:MAG: bifunctional UDP-3-O-[3-hydroxymyristoyl] N-acetylglucosamine deacetylase/3-hydroxyacyl-ACP dehydratase [Bacteroidetes bacterium]|nr:bifunctional UDP-3-O-[3-hydroxymyristoyl] N-acetylglucosamine deacetylase/3-hydroxyacyl-ACP dehydratase [Bacteroidota bacterium]